LLACGLFGKINKYKIIIIFMKDFLTDTLLILIRILTTIFSIPAVAFGVVAAIAIIFIIAVAALIATPLYLLYKLENHIYRI
jgi:hypothetical protein